MKRLAIVLPAHNEEEIIENSVRKMLAYLKHAKLPVNWKLIVAENGSTDRTKEILKNLRVGPRFSFLLLPARSRSKAIMQAWFATDSDYYMFMDADLATDIRHIPELVAGLEEGYDIVIGSRNLSQSQVNRTPFRKLLSFLFNVYMKILFSLPVKDLQCGFKAINRKVLNTIIKQIKYADEGFMDTEMLAVAWQKGYRIKEIPIRCNDTRATKFKLHKTIPAVLLNALRIKRDIILKKYH